MQDLKRPITIRMLAQLRRIRAIKLSGITDAIVIENDFKGSIGGFV